MQEGRDLWWHDIVPRQAAWCEPERMESEDMLYLLYTSGTTAKPKGILHTTGGYLTGVTSTHRNVFDIKEMTSSGRQPTSAGSPGTPTSSTARWPTTPPASCTRARRTGRIPAAGGTSSSATA